MTHITLNPETSFLQYPGLKTNGLLYLEEAFRRGAVIAVIDSEADFPVSFPVVKVENIRKVEGLAAALFYGQPSRKLRMIGITGANGKTTVAHLIRHLLDSSGVPTALLGTVWIDYGAGKQRSQRTTLDSIELQRLLTEMAGFRDVTRKFTLAGPSELWWILPTTRTL
jgi:UDP-N-acetylmuramoyl-L-alanyl-D-glutamate--2,6-diaminopimelate ligase